MKIKPLILGLLLLTASASVSLAGPRVSIAINTGGGVGYCPPVRPYCPPVAYCPPRWYGTPSLSYYPWGSSVYATSTSNGSFTTVSPVMNYANSAPVYQVPAPVLPAQPIVVSPGSPFRWKH